MKTGIEVLGDLLSFFESSPAFISVACEKLRKQHGPNFKLQTVKAILNLRTDLDKESREEAFAVCKEVLDSYKDGTYDERLKQKNGHNHAGIFEELDMTQNENENNLQKQNSVESLQDGDLEFDADDFLKAGGLDVDEM